MFRFVATREEHNACFVAFFEQRPSKFFFLILDAHTLFPISVKLSFGVYVVIEILLLKIRGMDALNSPK